jgi:hypothetical protein
MDKTRIYGILFWGKKEKASANLSPKKVSSCHPVENLIKFIVRVGRVRITVCYSGI